MKLSIIIPAYNEEKTILQLVNKVKKQEVPSVEKEIIVVDDGSNDKTYEYLKNVKGIALLKHDKNKGKGFAIRTGLTRTTGEIVLIQDADLELSPEDYPALVKPILDGKTKVVYGSRLLGTKFKRSPLFYAGGRFITLIANLLYGINITDEPIGYKVFKTDLLRSLNLECERFEFCPEVTAKIAKRKINIYEVPVKYNPRSVKEGKKLNAIKDGLQAAWVLLKYKFKD